MYETNIKDFVTETLSCLADHQALLELACAVENNPELLPFGGFATDDMNRKLWEAMNYAVFLNAIVKIAVFPTDAFTDIMGAIVARVPPIFDEEMYSPFEMAKMLTMKLSVEQ